MTGHATERPRAGRVPAPTRPTPLLVVAALVSLAGPPPVAAQAGGDGLEVAVAGTALAPLGRLTSDAVFATEVSSALGASAAATYWFGDALGVSALATWADGDLNIRPSEFTGPIPTDLGSAAHGTGSLNLVYRLRFAGPAAVLEPFFVLGGGVRRLDVDPIATPDVRDATDPMGTVAGGVYAHLWRPLAIRFEVRDFVSSYESPVDGDTALQNDVLVSVGLSVRP